MTGLILFTAGDKLYWRLSALFSLINAPSNLVSSPVFLPIKPANGTVLASLYSCSTVASKKFLIADVCSTTGNCFTILSDILSFTYQLLMFESLFSQRSQYH